MNQSEYEREFESIVSQLKAARRAYEVAAPTTRQVRLAELTVLKDKLLSLSAVHKQFPKNTYYKASLPENEVFRLKALQDLNVMDSPYEALFDSIANLASKICETPIALISLLDERRQWFKANIGLPKVKETPRELAFCGHAILTDTVMEIADATLDIRFAENPLVTGDPAIRFYAGAPITLPMGENIGTLCVIDRKANQLTELQKTALQGLAEVVSKALVARNVGLKNLAGKSM